MMSAESQDAGAELVSLTASIVSAYVVNNSVQIGDLSKLIDTVHVTLRDLGTPKSEPAPERPTPPVPVKKSITPDYLISLEDGRRYKSLKRHLSGRGLTPAQYRAKWGLPVEYPMVAPNYAKHRSELAKAAGLGRKRTEAAPAPARQSRRRSA